MITLKEAFTLCKVLDNEVVHFRYPGEHSTWAWAMTGKEVRNKYDMRKVQVISIGLRWCFGECEGFEFMIKRREKI